MKLEKLEEKLEAKLQWEMCTSCYGVLAEGSFCLECLGVGAFQDLPQLSVREQQELLKYARQLEDLVKDIRGYL